MCSGPPWAAALQHWGFRTMNLRRLPAVVAVFRPADTSPCSGDLAYSGGTVSIWDRFHQVLEPVASRIPMAVIPGNWEFDYPGRVRGAIPTSEFPCSVLE